MLLLCLFGLLRLSVSIYLFVYLFFFKRRVLQENLSSFDFDNELNSMLPCRVGSKLLGIIPPGPGGCSNSFPDKTNKNETN